MLCVGNDCPLLVASGLIEPLLKPFSGTSVPIVADCTVELSEVHVAKLPIQESETPASE